MRGALLCLFIVGVLLVACGPMSPKEPPTDAAQVGSGEEEVAFRWYVPKPYVVTIQDRLPDDAEVKPAPERGAGAIFIDVMVLREVINIVSDVVCEFQPSVIVDARVRPFVFESDPKLPRGLLIIVTESDRETLTCADRSRPSLLAEMVLQKLRRR
jgi:hypothetical protein